MNLSLLADDAGERRTGAGLQVEDSLTGLTDGPCDEAIRAVMAEHLTGHPSTLDVAARDRVTTRCPTAGSAMQAGEGAAGVVHPLHGRPLGAVVDD